MKRWYFDHAAATPVNLLVIKEMGLYLATDFANPSAIYTEGILAREVIENAREKISNILQVNKKSCIFTSSATESIFLGIVGCVNAWKEDHKNEIPEIIVSSIEHDAVLSTAKYLENQGAVVHLIPVDEFGFVDLDFISKKINMNTVIISVGLVNNEIGTISRINEISKIIRQWKKDFRNVTRDKDIKDDDVYPLLHTDGTQAVCYYGLSIPKLGADLFSCNSSKIYGPKGVGLLLRNTYVKMLPVMISGSQEFGLRPGTEPVSLIAGFAEAFKIAQENAVSETFRLKPLQEKLFKALTEISEQNNYKLFINGPVGDERIVNNINISFDKVNHEYLSILLDNDGFSVSTKSACNERSAEESHVLAALANSNKDQIKRPLSGLRITMGSSTTEEGINVLVKSIEKNLKIALNNII